MNVSDDIARYIRTFVVVAVGGLLTYVASLLHIAIGPDTKSGIAIFAAGIVISAYYALARYVEKKWPAVGKILLGAPKPLTGLVSTLGDTADGNFTPLPPTTSP